MKSIHVNNLEQEMLWLNIDLLSIIQKYPLPPASIVSVNARLYVLTLQKGETNISMDTLMLCLKDEQIKNAGRTRLEM